MSLKTLKPRPNNPRLAWTDPQRAAFQKSLKEFGDLGGIVKNRRTGHLVGGHKRTDEFRADPDAAIEITQRLKRADAAGTVAVGWITTNGTRFAYREVDWTKAKEAAANLAANQHGADFDMDLVGEMLKELPSDFDFSMTGFDQPTINDLMGVVLPPESPRASLAERFGVPPFSVLDARQGYWQARKRAWLALGIKSELGRGANVLDMSASMAGIPAGPERDAWYKNRTKEKDRLLLPKSSDTDFYIQKRAKEKELGRKLTTEEFYALYTPSGAGNGGTSIFDPVLCELAYRWFCPAGGEILDPFAGGSVRGIVASKLGFRYTGIDIAAAQVEANRAQAKAICKRQPTWINGDSRTTIAQISGDADFVFSCPPYFDLEVYSDAASDISSMSWDDFSTAYRTIIAAAVGKLRPNRFACFVVGDVRDKRGFFRNLPGYTIDCFQAASATLYNDAILVTSVGSLPLRIAKQFEGYRKLGTTHQRVLVFFKGDPKTVKSWDKPDFGDKFLADPTETASTEP